VDQDKTLGIIIGGFVTLIIGIILLNSIGASIDDATLSKSVGQESIVIASSSGTTLEDDLIGVSFFGNKTINTSNYATELNTMVNWTAAGLITVSPGNLSDETYEISYTYTGNNYVNDSKSRTILRLIPIFFVIGGVLLVGIGIALKAGILDLTKKR